MKSLNTHIALLVLFALFFGSLVTYYQLRPQRCDHLVFSMVVESRYGFSTTTGVYKGLGLYTYPESSVGQTIVFSMFDDFRIGQYIDQCINLNRYDNDPHKNIFDLKPLLGWIGHLFEIPEVQ